MKPPLLLVAPSTPPLGAAGLLAVLAANKNPPAPPGVAPNENPLVDAPLLLAAPNKLPPVAPKMPRPGITLTRSKGKIPGLAGRPR